MALELSGVLLGLGSVVRLDGDRAPGLFIVLARGAFRPDSEKNEVIPRYLVGPHPYGEAPDKETFPILASEIDEVVFEGYSDGEDAAFIADLLDQMENGRRDTKRAKQFTEALTAIPEAAESADNAENDESDQRSEDPFFELRKLARGEERRHAP